MLDMVAKVAQTFGGVKCRVSMDELEHRSRSNRRRIRIRLE